MRGNTFTTTRIGAYVASAALVVSGTALVATPAEAVAHDPIGSTQSAAWIKGQLAGSLVPSGFDPPYDKDVGLSIDVAFALNAVGGNDTTVQSITDAVAANIDDYSGFGAGSIAKAAVLAGIAGRQATDFGGNNLVADVESAVATTAPNVGRVQEMFGGTDYGNTLKQAYATRALSATGSGDAGDVRDFLLEQQCTDGYFRLNFAHQDSGNQACVNSADAPDTDATAIAVLQLSALTSPTTAVTTAIARAKAWLLAQQKPDGSWGGGTTTEASNANSTGLAAWALGENADSEKAAQWLRAHQATYVDTCDKLAGEVGAVAYDDAALAAGRTGGITSGKRDQWRRASAQALPALAHLPQDTTPSAPVLSGPTTYVKARSRQVLTTTGVRAGDQLCLTGVGVAAQTVSTGTSARSTVTLWPGTATRVYTVRDANGRSDTFALRVLGAKKLPVTRSSYRVKRKRPVTVTVRGLMPREWSQIVYKGRVVKAGPASATGNLTATFKVGRATGRKRVVGFGRFGDIRRGTTTIKIVR